MHRKSARFYGGFLWTTAAAFTGVALTWWFDAGTGRENAIEWMQGIINTTTIASLWTIGAVCAAVGAVACRRVVAEEALEASRLAALHPLQLVVELASRLDQVV